MDQMYLENLEEFINDECKMVTYKWLSRNLQVHVNQAKQMLYKFVQEQRNKADNDNLCVTYCVAGFTTNEDGNKVHKVQIVPEERCDLVKKNLNPVTTCHIYSVQKGKLKDVNMLYTADYDQLKENLFHSNKFSAITCITAKLRSTNEIEELQSRASIKNEQTECLNGHSTTNGSVHHVEKKKTSPSKKQGGIAGMFAAASKKKETDPSEDVKREIGTTKTDTSKKQENSRAKGKQGGVMSLFANQANKPKVERKPESTVVSPRKENEDKITRGKKKKGESDEENESDKKRRRVQVWESGSSGSESEMEIEGLAPSPPPPEPEIKEEPADPSPTPSPRRSPRKSPVKSSQPKPLTSPEKSKSPAAKCDSSGHKRRVKKRKMVTKTFMDDDGYIVTEKVNEEVSTDASDTEDVIPSKTSPAKKSPSKPAAKKPSPKKRSPGKSKQQNIMSFFKKK